MIKYEETYNSELVCPYCKHQFQDSFELSDEDEDFECYNCKKKFMMYREVSVDYKAVPDCELNGATHHYEKFSERTSICSVCDKYTLKKTSTPQTKGKE